VVLLNYAVKYEANFVRQCKQENVAGYGTDDWGHLFPPLGFLFYCTYILLETLGMPLSFKRFYPAWVKRLFVQPRAYAKSSPESSSSSSSNKDKQAAVYRRVILREQVVFTILGAFLMLILSADIPGKVAKHMFPKHFILGFYICLSGVLGILLSTKNLIHLSFPFVSPLVFIYLGMMFMFHEQYSYFAYFMHTVFGYLLVGFGILGGFRIVYPRLTILFTFVGHFAAFVFIGTDNGLVVYLEPIITPHHFVLFILNGVLFYTVIVVGFAYIYLRRKERLNGNNNHVHLENFSILDEKQQPDEFAAVDEASVYHDN